MEIRATKPAGERLPYADGFATPRDLGVTRVLLDDVTGTRIEYRPVPTGVEVVRYRPYCLARQGNPFQAARESWADILQQSTADTL